jgi:glycosyltransferase involved in cell wall biosynthesis
MERMRVLHLLPESPFPADTGPRHHALGLLRAASERCDCEVLGFYAGDEGRERWERFREEFPEVRVRGLVPETGGARAAAGLFSSVLRLEPPVLRRYRSARFAGRLRQLLAETRYDLVHVDQFKLARYGALCEGIARLLVPHDAYSLAYHRAYRVSGALPRRTALYLLYRGFSRLERTVYPRYDRVCPVSSVDAEWLRARVPGVRVEVLEIPIGEEFFAAGAEPRVPGPAHVVCGGPVANEYIARDTVAFLERLLPRFRAEVGGRVTVWGQSPARSLREFIERTPDVDHLSWADDYIGTLRSASVYVYAQHVGSGIQTKVQQAMALGIPVVARSEHLAPLGVSSGEQAIACDEPSAMADAVIGLLQDGVLGARMGAAARRHVRSRFGAEAIGDRLAQIYGELRSAPGRRRGGSRAAARGVITPAG